MAPSRAADQVGRALRILVVEDEPGIGLFVRRALQNARWQVDLATTGAEALAILEDPDREHEVLLVDRGLPDMCGDDVVRQAMLLRPEAGIVVATGDPYAESPPHDARLQKPYGPVQLLDAVKAALVSSDQRRVAGRRVTGALLMGA